jgi:hypothetical protein
MKSKSLLVRFRDRDSKDGVTRRTLKNVAAALGVSETEAIHRALADYARRNMPQYAAEEKALSTEIHERIEQAVRRQHGDAKMIESLFDEPAAVAPRAARSVSSTRRR